MEWFNFISTFIEKGYMYLVKLS